MKKIISIALSVLLSFSLVLAQDARQRTVETIVADVVAEMPAQNAAAFDRTMADIAKAAPRSVELLAAMLVPQDKGKNNLVEYALSGVTKYVSDPAHSQYKAAVTEGFKAGAAACADKYNKQFLEWNLYVLGPVQPVAEMSVPADNPVLAKALVKTGHTGERSAAASTLVSGLTADKAVKFLGKALKDSDRSYRNAVMDFVSEKAGIPAVGSFLVKTWPKLSEGARTDALNFFGNNNISSSLPLVLSQISKGGEIGATAVTAAGKMGGPEALSSLISLLVKGGEKGEEALEALKSFKGDISGAVMDALAKDKYNGNLLRLASARRILSAAPNAFALASSDDLSTRAGGERLLSGLVTSNDIPKLASLLDRTDTDGVKTLTGVLAEAMRNLGGKERYDVISSILPKMGNPSRLYPALASSNTDQAVEYLSQAVSVNPSAVAALASMSNYKAAPAIISAIKSAPASFQDVIPSYVSLVNDNEADFGKKVGLLSEVLGLTTNPSRKGDILSVVGTIPTRKAFNLAGDYLADPDRGVRRQAAYAVKNIADKCEDELDYDKMKSAFEKGAETLLSTGDPDDGYAVNQMNSILSKYSPSPVSSLTPEEEKLGFEMLFDGTSLDKWQGNFVNYTLMNGTIYISADGSGTGNLYTKKKYRDFVYRFEFCFLREGVNNGVGVRTPIGVDAAYDGMCEVQILDHDAPMYANLNDYQVHGSAYGIIPAKRIKHKPLGEWSTEEIEVRGNHVKVTVNGEVILDGDLRKACKGHNVAPDGSAKNPYTVDHRNHPGMFNKDGYISFCGHGEGVKIRNVRVLDLSK